jgi:hypothetical protein
LLNVIHEPAYLWFRDYGLLKAKYEPMGFEQTCYPFKGKDMGLPKSPKANPTNPYTIETALFLYDYEEPNKS